MKSKAQTLVLKVGALKDSDYYVQKAGGADVWIVKKWMGDRFLKKASDLAPTQTAAAPGAPAKKK